MHKNFFITLQKLIMSCIRFLSGYVLIVTIIRIHAKHLISFNVAPNESIQCQDGCTPLTDFCVCPPSLDDNYELIQEPLSAVSPKDISFLDKKDDEINCKCYEISGSKYCSCNEEKEKEIPKQNNLLPIKSSKCSNHGIYDSLGVCFCDKGFTGMACQYQIKMSINLEGENENSVYLNSLCKFLMNHNIFKMQGIVIKFCRKVHYQSLF